MDSKDKKNDQAAVGKKDDKRRKLLKSIVAGGGAATVGKMLPDNWARPVVDSVMLPSHAQTSDSGPVMVGPFASAAGPFAMAETDTDLVAQGFSEELLEFFAPVAQAVLPAMVYLNEIRFANNEGSPSFLCADLNASTQTIMVTVNNDTFTPAYFPSYLFGYPVEGGQFNGSGWVVSFINNSAMVELTPGGLGCNPPT